MDYCVYIHRKKTNGEIFYVGKGRNRRPTQTSGRNVFWHSVVNKHGYLVEIVCSGIQHWYALELEAELIALYGKRQDGSGCLVNMADGGEVGNTGWKMSDYTKDLIRQKILQRGAHPNLKRPRPPKTESHRKKISDANRGLKRSEETRKRMSDSRKGYKPSAEAVRKMAYTKSDNKIYTIMHDNGDIFIGTRYEFNVKYNINIKPLFQKNPPKLGKAKGWRLLNG